ncbi:MAG: 2-C-methyl-D-erythritol 4-phosphate cytidylyltransferase [Treponema brennaborense]|nr:2-C-methyl-D-erythritol 4-phosphate cytidylyltransferase [Prevotella sp.]MCM1407868.1 2-C-methyl-D-erythritol 4-phosphate cytidylyltransferase [Treponema brennaborense]
MSLNDKPVIIHTLENFQRNNNIDGIIIVCVKDWMIHLKEILNEYAISKVFAVVEGGGSGHDSTRNGLFFLRDKLSPEDYVVIHDAARPILPQAAINDMLRVAHEKGNASLAIPCYETILLTDDGKSGASQLDRSKIMRIQTPQCYQFGPLLELYERAETEDKHDFIYADLVLVYYGKTVYFSRGFANNIKITRKEDVPLCKALMHFSEEELFS